MRRISQNAWQVLDNLVYLEGDHQYADGFGIGLLGDGYYLICKRIFWRFYWITRMSTPTYMKHNL